MARKHMHEEFGSEHAPDAALSIHDMTVAYQRRPVLWDLDLDIPRGVLAAVIGPNGAGKSTMIKLLTGEIEPKIGSVWKHPNAKVAY